MKHKGVDEELVVEVRGCLFRVPSFTESMAGPLQTPGPSTIDHGPPVTNSESLVRHGPCADTVEGTSHWKPSSEMEKLGQRTETCGGTNFLPVSLDLGNQWSSHP